MNIVNSCLLRVGGMEVLVVRKPVKNLHLSLLPPDGRIRVTSPTAMKDDAIRTLIATRLPWIRKHQRQFEGQERQGKREYISGESHYLFGQRFLLDLVHEEAVPLVSFKGKKKIVLQVRPKATVAKKAEVLNEWYRKQLEEVLTGYVSKWEKKIGVKTTSWNIRKMKTRWGTCNHKTGHVWFNLELAKKPLSTIEYVVVHELLHLIEKTHNDRFVKLLDRHMPKWRSEKNLLNRFILSYEHW
jgi:predicted metal-dependent hydrolase